MARARATTRPRIVGRDVRRGQLVQLVRPVEPTDQRLAAPTADSWMARQRNLTLALIFVPPLGAVVAWMTTRWPSWAKWLATAWAMLWILAAIGFAISVLAPHARQPAPPTSWALPLLL